MDDVTQARALQGAATHTEISSEVVVLDDQLLSQVVGGFGPNGSWSADIGPNGGWND